MSNKFGLHVLEIVVIDVELALECTIRHPLPLTEHVNHLIEDGVKVHRGSSCTGRGITDPLPYPDPRVRPHAICTAKSQQRKAGRRGGVTQRSPHAHRDRAWGLSPHPIPL